MPGHIQRPWFASQPLELAICVIKGNLVIFINSQCCQAQLSRNIIARIRILEGINWKPKRHYLTWRPWRETHWYRKQLCFQQCYVFYAILLAQNGLLLVCLSSWLFGWKEVKICRNLDLFVTSTLHACYIKIQLPVIASFDISTCYIRDIMPFRSTAFNSFQTAFSCLDGRFLSEKFNYKTATNFVLSLGWALFQT
jgi:hypothetical protein